MDLPGQALSLGFLGVDQHFHTGQRTLHRPTRQASRGAVGRGTERLSKGGLEPLQVLFLILQFFELTAHDQQTLLGIQGRIVDAANLTRRHRIELVLHLLKMGSNGCIPLGKFGNFTLALFDH